MDIREKSSPALTGGGEKELFLKYTGAVYSLSQGLRSGQAALPGPNLPDGEGGIPSTATLVHGREGKHLTPAPSSLPRKGNAQLRTPPAAPPICWGVATTGEGHGPGTQATKGWDLQEV